MQTATGAFLVVVGHPHEHEENHISEPRINDRIRVPEVRLVGPNGEQVGIVRVEDALRLAAEADLDLVEVAPNARPPVCKLMDFGKFKYESDMKAREARRNQTNTVIKEIKLRPKIDPHDYGTKKGHVERFLKAGDKVKVTIMFRGREQSRPELGFRLLQRLAEDIGELGFVESTPKQDGRNMIMVIGPTRKKAEAKAEERRRREQASGPRPAGADGRGRGAGAVEHGSVDPGRRGARSRPRVEAPVEAPPVDRPRGAGGRLPSRAAEPHPRPAEAELQPVAEPSPQPAARAEAGPAKRGRDGDAGARRSRPAPAKKAAAKRPRPRPRRPRPSRPRRPRGEASRQKPADKPAAKPPPRRRPTPS